jgi:DNA repair protein RadC
MLGIKRVENRSVMPVPAKGRCAVGCSKSFSKQEYGNFVQWASRALPSEDFERIPAWSDVKDWPGKIVGACDYEGRGRNDFRLEGGEAARPRGTDAAVAGRPPYQWDEGYAYWWDLSEVVCFDEPIPCRGNVGMWQMPPVLAERVTETDAQARAVGTKIASAEDAARLFRAAIPIAGNREGFFVLPLDAEKRVLAAPMLVSLGHEDGTTVIDAGAIFREALKAGAEEIIVAHNHPSGDPTPSKPDIVTTAKLREAGAMLGVPLIDHLILGAASSGGRHGFISLAEYKEKK